MAAPTIYTLFRYLIGDSDTPYTLIDLALLKYLDTAIEKLSIVSEFNFKETITVSSQDVTNGYINLSHEIVQILECTGLGTEHYTWEYGGGTKIRIIDSAFPTGTYTIRYRAKYKKFNGVMLSQNDMDFPVEAEFPVVLYALGFYMQSKGISNVDSDTIGAIKQKSEESMSVTYGLDGVIAEEMSSPAKIMQRAISLMRDLPTAQDIFFSVKVS